MTSYNDNPKKRFSSDLNINSNLAIIINKNKIFFFKKLEYLIK